MKHEKGKPGRKPTAEKAVEKLEENGHLAAAAIVRETAGMPPRPLTEDEEFLHEVVQLTVAGPPVGFNCDNETEAIHRAGLVAGILAPTGRAYRVVRKGARVEVTAL